jgi:predicted PurR-regulated permease PerM
VSVSETTSRIDVNARSVALTLIAFAAGMALLYWAREVFIPIVLSILISYALEPIVNGLMRLRLPRVAAAALVMALLTGSVGYGAYALSDDATAVLAELPDAAAKLRVALRADPKAGTSTNEQVKKAAEEQHNKADE